MPFLYLTLLAVSLAAFVVIDWRWRLVLVGTGRRGLVAGLAVIVVGVAGLLAWDVAGIALGIFFRGTSWAMTGVLIGPELPVEEVAFLTFLCYQTLVYAALGRRLLLRRALRRTRGAGVTG